MTKVEFFKRCDRFLHGTCDKGILDVHVDVGTDPVERIGGDWGIYLRGYPASRVALGYTLIETTPQRKSDAWKTARQKCEAKLPKYKRWLEEWKAMNPPQDYSSCPFCHEPVPACRCDPETPETL